MSDPPRLRDLPDGDAFTRGLLRAAEPTRPLPPAHALRLEAVVARVAATPAAAGLAATAAPWVLAAVTAVGAAAALAPRRPPAHRAAPVALSTAPNPSRAAPVAPSTAPNPPRAAPVAPRLRAGTAPAPTAVPAEAPPPEPTLADENRVNAAVRAALRDDPARALALLDDASRAMPNGQLRDEREALAIEALLRAGRTDEARARLEVFARRAPSNPQGARLRALLRDAP